MLREVSSSTGTTASPAGPGSVATGSSSNSSRSSSAARRNAVRTARRPADNGTIGREYAAQAAAAATPTRTATSHAGTPAASDMTQRGVGRAASER